MAKTRILLLIIVLGAVVGFFGLDLGRFLTLEYFRSQQAAITAWHHAHPWEAALGFFAVYVAVTGLSLPGAAVMTLVGGAIFGLLRGTVIVSFASTLGATLAFLVSRLLLRDIVQSRFGRSLRAVNEGIRREGAFYLFTLRLVPAFPFFVINLVMGLTPLRTLTFMVVSQIGMLPGTVVYVNAGTQLAQIDTLAGVLSPGVIVSFTLLGVFPLVAKKTVDYMRSRKVLRKYARPRRYDRNLVVIGAGSAGLVSAYIAAAVKAKVTLVERHRMGGDCLNTGCVPSKAFIRSARFLADVRRARALGFKSADVDFDFADVMARVQRVISTIEPHDSVERYTALGVECLRGKARIDSPYAVEVDGRVLTTRNIVIAAGARPFVPPIPGIEEVGYLTSDTVWELRSLPARLVVLGGGPIGCELAQCFARFGSRVTVVEMLPRLLVKEDAEISEKVMDRFRDEGIDLRLEHKARAFRVQGNEKLLLCEHGGEEVAIPFDEVLVAVGRVANTEGYGLEDLGVPLTSAGTVEVNGKMQTIYPNIYACGDVSGPFQFTHIGAHQAWYATVNALFGGLKTFTADYSVVPWATFTDPEVARVGLNETEARQRGIDYEVTTYGIEELDRAIVDEAAHGVVKVLTIPGKDRILGVTIAGEHAGEIISEYVLAMRHGLGLNRILRTVHIYPTLAEANKFAAGEWRKAHAPERLLRWMARFHAWRREGAAALLGARTPETG
ncbi:MAG: FAD-dependent oxidoreductase [Gammaproteobacteria bacterium]|nr:FAD-dependent oxidoreductase [Gammaproteobacteria bacterium]NIR83066.1 FAD-dependent oxidoreductase [Gammaproteobacteria bacterium]NIR90728.1 FAD-dependent oxidoreductase [Gammaproteobacteria bacterium]NIU04219.1 FAD-dependent oxidoreductase [Gammaproteobacteria bacterium]NIV51511.1 FAD-dependent oxidoreductase [Gammaproteobacteria bacterium]